MLITFSDIGGCMFAKNISLSFYRQLAYIFVLSFSVLPYLSFAADKPLKIPGIEKNISWVNKPQEYYVTDNGIQIIAGEKTDMYIAPDYSYAIDSAPRALFDSDKDFIFSTAIQHSFANKWDGGAIVLEADKDNWIKFCFEKDYTGAKRVVSVVTKGISDDANSIEFSQNIAHYKMAKKEDTVYLYVSKTGKDWYLVRAINFKFNKVLKLGLLAQSPEGKVNAVSFSNVKYSASTIKDFWVGE